MKKPVKPVKPSPRDYPSNIYGPPKDEKHPYIKAYRKWEKDCKAYEAELERYEQIKLINLVKNTNEEGCLRRFKISKR